MKKLPSVLLLCSVFLSEISCNKSNNTDTVAYEVKTTSGTWSGDYFDYANNNQSLKFVSSLPSGWKYSFSVVKGKKLGLVLSAIPDNVNGSTTAIANIYLNNKIISTDTSAFGATAQITINQ
jgi:hypothetical protein